MRHVLALASLVVPCACAGAPPSSPAASVAEVPRAGTGQAAGAEAPSRVDPPAAACDTEQLPPKELVADNLGATDVTGLAEITAASVSDPQATGGYVNVLYDVRVLEQYAGSSLPNELRLSQGAEVPAHPRAIGTLLFFSACRSGDGTAFEPDVGYFFPIPPGCRPQIEAMARAAQAQHAERSGPFPACAR